MFKVSCMNHRCKCKVEEDYPNMQQVGFGNRCDFFFLLAGIILMLSIFHPLFSVAQSSFEVTAKRLNVRKSPSAESSIIGGLSKGDVVNVRELKKSWAEIDYKSSVGYVSAKFIQPVEEEPVPEQISEPEEIIEVDTVVQNDESEMIEVKTDSKNIMAFLNQLRFVPTATLSLGLSDFYSFDAYSHPRFSFGFDAGTRISADFMPDWMFSEATVGFMLLGNSNYSFPSFSFNVLPVGYRSDIFNFWKLENIRFYGIAGFSFQFSGGEISFTRNSHHYSFDSKPTTNLYIKGGVEITDKIAVGLMYMHGFDNVCRDLPIGIKNSVFQLYGSFLFNKWNKK